MTPRIHWLIFGALLLVVLTSVATPRAQMTCGSDEGCSVPAKALMTTTPTPTATATKTATPTPTLTATPTETATP